MFRFLLSSLKLPLVLMLSPIRSGPNVVGKAIQPVVGGASAPPHLGPLIGLCMNWSTVYSN